MPIQSTILLHGNAQPHTAALAQEKMDKIRWKTLELPPCRPDLSPCDYHMFGSLKEEVGGHYFEDDEGVEIFMRNRLQTRQASFFDNEIKKLPIRWEKCVNQKGDYIEK